MPLPNPQTQQPQQQTPVFNMPQPQQQIQQPPMAQPEGQQPAQPEKKGHWKKWLVILLVIIVATGLGYYLLA